MFALTLPAPHVALLTLDRPEAANALNTALAGDIASCFNGLAANVRAVVLTGAGKAFCAGADLKERNGMNEQQWETQHAALRSARDAILHCHVPVIAAVNGAAFGGGLELALACDFIYAAADAKMGFTEATLGIMPGMGGVDALARAAGERRALELLYTGRAFTAEEAQEWGIANAVYAPEQLIKEALATAMKIVEAAPLAVKAIKRSARETRHLPANQAIAAELVSYRMLLSSNDRHEGINAFNEKRKALFRGE